jgi:pimeloyl-ACP methyl ester carboxylesterase
MGTMRYQNPDFPIPPGGLRAEVARMLGLPVVAPRPIITLSGWRALRFPAQLLASRLRRLVGNAETLAVSFTLVGSIEAAAAKVVERVSRRFPGGNGGETVEVDVVGTSMGGLVARLAAIPEGGRPRLRIARLFTLGTPHRGAAIAQRIAVDESSRSMRSGSELLRRLDAALPGAGFELICYARLRDRWVDARNTAPVGREPFWVPGPLLLSHHTITNDRLIVCDIARRIRGEAPFATRATPPPRW